MAEFLFEVITKTHTGSLPIFLKRDPPITDITVAVETESQQCSTATIRDNVIPKHFAVNLWEKCYNQECYKQENIREVSLSNLYNTCDFSSQNRLILFTPDITFPSRQIELKLEKMHANKDCNSIPK